MNKSTPKPKVNRNYSSDKLSNKESCVKFRVVPSAIIGGGGGGGGGAGGVYSYNRVLPDGFLLKAIVFTVFENNI